MRKILLFLLCIQILCAYTPLPEPRNEEEALYVRRIIKFWRDRDYELAKEQIESFLESHIDSPFTDHFQAMLGDIFLHHKEFSAALDCYEKIHSKTIASDVLTKRFQALCGSGRYKELYDECKVAYSLSDEGKFYFAESCFRQGMELLSRNEEAKAHDFFDEALPLYQQLFEQKTLGNFSKLGTAEILRLRGDHEKAASLYFKLTSDKSDQATLFYAAAMLQNIDEPKSTKLFEELAKQGHLKATAQWMRILAKNQKWQEIQNNRELFLSYKGDEIESFAYFFLGMASKEEDNHLQAILDLTKSLQKNLDPSFKRMALLALMFSSKEIGRIEAAEKSLVLLKASYPDDLPEGMFLLSLCYAKGGEKKKALAMMEEFFLLFPSHTLAEKVFFEKVRLLAQMEEWKKAREGILAFFDRYPQSGLKTKMASFAVDLSLTQNLYEDLIHDIERGLVWQAFEDERDKKLLLAKAYFKIDNTARALEILLGMDPQDSFLITQCYVKEANHPKIIEYGERALIENPAQELLHLHLFNAYQALYLVNKESQIKEKAAFHLNLAADICPISLENRLWLAHYLCKQNRPRSIHHLEILLQTDAHIKRFYEDALLLAEMYMKEKQPEKASSLLEKMIAIKGGSEAQAELILADLYLGNNNDEKAKSFYVKLECSSNAVVAAKAKLQMARIEFSNDVEKGLKSLAELVQRRVLSNEPIHLEAAIEFAERKASLMTDTLAQEEALLDNFIAVKEEFTSKENIWAKDYHASRTLLPEKDRIYQAYMRYLDARIYLLQSKFAPDPAQQHSKLQAAIALLSTLRQGKYAVTDYLVERAKEKLYEK